MTSEFDKLSDPQRAAVAKAIARSQQSNQQENVPISSKQEAYAYPHVLGKGRVCWGVNNVICIARGVWPEEETS